jgi:hypothetical protein
VPATDAGSIGPACLERMNDYECRPREGARSIDESAASMASTRR